MSTITIDPADAIAPINPNVFGHFAEHLGNCIYDGIWVGEQKQITHTGGISDQVVALLKRIRPSVVRWPGGCFADGYHWEDGIGPAGKRPRRVNIHWGNVVDDNAFGTHEFLAFCRAVEAAPYLCGNVGSSTPRELRDWIEYCNYPSGSTLSDRRIENGHEAPMNVRYWGVGNESWGCGGFFSPEDYATEYRRWSVYCRNYNNCPPYLIACGPDGNSTDWTRRFFEKLKKDFGKHAPIHGYAPHYYCGTSGTATEYSDAQWYELLMKSTRMEKLIVDQQAIMEEFDPQKRVKMIVDEWGTWHPATPGRNPGFLWQQNTLRDALVAGITLNCFIGHADVVSMANIAQTVNVLQALILTDKGKVITTPTYHVFEMFQPHYNAMALRTRVEAEEIGYELDNEKRKVGGMFAAASLHEKTLTLTIVNPRIGEPSETRIVLKEGSASGVRQTVLTHSSIKAHNTFEEPENLTLGETVGISVNGADMVVQIPGQSVVRLDMILAWWGGGGHGFSV